MTNLDQVTTDLYAVLDGQDEWTSELRTHVTDILWHGANDRMLRNLADLIGRSDLAPKRLVQSVKEIAPLVGVVSTTDFLEA